MRTTILITAAGLSMFAAALPARAQYFGWGYYRPYYPVPYSYYPGPYYRPAPEYDAPSRPAYRHRAAVRIQHRATVRRQRVSHRQLINPLLGPLPGSPR